MGLWTRLAGFTTDELSRLLSERTVARAPVIRASFIGRTGGPAIWVPAVRGTQSACRVRLASLQGVWQPQLMKPLLEYVDAVTVPVPDLDRGLAFYRDMLGHQLIWRSEAAGQAGLRTPGSATEIVLATRQGYEPDWKVASADAAAGVFAANGGRVLAGPMDIPIGRLAIVEDPFGNRLVLLDSTKGTYDTDESGTVTGVS